jgi:gamma-glutamyl hercynylcysteine S-oxide synthase
MHTPSLTAAEPGTDALLARNGGADWLAQALQASRRDTLGTFAAYEHALPGLQVPQRAEFNPPLWELGHIGWFQSWWLARYPQRALGAAADPEAPRLPAGRANADAMYDSSRVPHASRWSLPLPDAQTTRDDLAQQLQQTLALLGDAADDDAALYFFRLALLHEDMHHEAALYMAQGLGIAIDDARWLPQPLPPPGPALHFDATVWQLGNPVPGFAFDNELCAHAVEVPAFSIDAQALRWAEYLPFVEADGYTDARWWSDDGAAWLRQSGAGAPRDLRRDGGTWLQRRLGRWRPLDVRLAASHLNHHEASAWCRWAGRRLPTEAEWERAACTSGAALRWGDVWEWTASAFAPYPGFSAHPYRDYSAPWFDGRPVLRGASHLTQPRMHHPRYRNYFTAARNDIAAGLRSCAR